MPEGGVILQGVTALILAGAVYGGIRSDLKAIHEHLRRVERAAEKAHDRIDRCGCSGRRASDGTE